MAYTVVELLTIHMKEKTVTLTAKKIYVETVYSCSCQSNMDKEQAQFMNVRRSLAELHASSCKLHLRNHYKFAVT